MKFILGKKLNMSQIWVGEEAVAVTRVLAGPCVVTQVKLQDKDGYSAVQIGFGAKKEKNINKPQRNHTKGLGNIFRMREFRLDKKGYIGDKVEIKRGDFIGVSTFEAGDIVDVRGTSKGKGFQGVVKRHGFSGQENSHGTKDQVRMPGSIGAKGPAHVFKGLRMGGHTGSDTVTMKNLEIVGVEEENNILLIKGAVPGAINGLLEIRGKGELKIMEQKINNKEPEINKEAKTEDVEIEKIDDSKQTAEIKEGAKEEVKAEEKIEEVEAEEVKS